MLEFTDNGMYCPRADLYIDPWKPVKTAEITHGHSDHARPGNDQHCSHSDTAAIVQLRLGEAIDV